MKRTVCSRIYIFMTVLLAVLLPTGLVLATVISVDGNPTDWPGHPNCTAGADGCSLVVTDPDEQPDTVDGIRNQYDIEQVWFTNSTTHAYWRIDTYDPIDFNKYFEELDICLDTDNDPNTGYKDLACNNIGTDRIVRMVNWNGTIIVRVLSCTPAGCATDLGYGNRGIGIDPADNNGVVEVRVPIATMGFVNAESYPMAVYFDNQQDDNDDHVPDLGWSEIIVGSGSPTAVELASLQARSSAGSTGALVLVGVLLVGSLGLLRAARRRRA